MTVARDRGTAVVELALLLPALLLLLAAACAAARSAVIHSAAASAAQAATLRSGRRLPLLSSSLADSVVPGGRGVSVRAEKGQSALLLPRPFPSMAGRTIGIAEASPDWGEMPTPCPLPPVRFVRRAEISVDSWDRGSPSGRKARGAVLAVVGSAVAR